MAEKIVNQNEVECEAVEEVADKKAAVNVLDLLLGADINEIKLPTKEVEITRLSTLYGKPFILRCQALTPGKYEEVQDMALDVKGKDVDLDVSQLQLLTVIEGVVMDNGAPLFKSAELREKFHAPTPKELVRKILLSGEITSVYTEIAKLSGFDDGAVREVKN